MATFLLILNIILLECILSLDNATALAVLVKNLPPIERIKALRYGMWGAYIFRGVALFLASYFVHFDFVKVIGGAYLLYISLEFFVNVKHDEEDTKPIWASFWRTVALVEMMDMVFSIDNILAVVAMTSNMWAIIAGVFIGIACMRFMSGVFSSLLEKYPDLEKSAFLVIAILGYRLILGPSLSFLGFHELHHTMESDIAGITYTVLTLIIFSYPFFKKYVQNTREASRTSIDE